MKICKNCGAEIGDQEASCSYCGALQYETAEKEYWDKMDQVQKDMEELKKVPENTYRQEIRRHTGAMRKWIVSGCMIFMLIAGLVMAYSYVSEKADAKRQKEQLIWQQENFPKLDAWYEAGEYDAILDFQNHLYAEGSPYNTWNWKHTQFIECYRSYWIYKVILDELQNEYAEGLSEKIREYDLKEMLYETMYLHTMKERNLQNDEEWHFVRDCQEETLKKTAEVFSLTEEEMEELAEMICKEGFADFEVCEEYVEKWLAQKHE